MGGNMTEREENFEKICKAERTFKELPIYYLIDVFEVDGIAQELQKIIPQAVTKNNEGYLAINAEWINYTVINSIKELANQVEIIQKEFTSYVKEFVMLAKKVNTLEKQIKNLEQENKVLLTSVDKAYRKAKAKK